MSAAPSEPLPKLHEPNAEARARGYLRGAVVRWYEDIGIVVGHDRDGDPWIDFGGSDPEAFDATKSSLSLERPAPSEQAPAPLARTLDAIGVALGLPLGASEIHALERIRSLLEDRADLRQIRQAIQILRTRLR